MHWREALSASGTAVRGLGAHRRLLAWLAGCRSALDGDWRKQIMQWQGGGVFTGHCGYLRHWARGPVLAGALAG
jgi:hypothetical protein